MIQRALSYGVVFLFRGMRQGRPGLAGFGAALAVLGWLRGRRKPKNAAVYRTRLRDGATLRVRYLEGDHVVDELDVTA